MMMGGSLHQWVSRYSTVFYKHSQQYRPFNIQIAHSYIPELYIHCDLVGWATALRRALHLCYMLVMRQNEYFHECSRGSANQYKLKDTRIHWIPVRARSRVEGASKLHSQLLRTNSSYSSIKFVELEVSHEGCDTWHTYASSWDRGLTGNKK